MTEKGFRFLIPVRAGWAGAGFSPWAIKSRGAGFSQGYSFGQRAEGTERSSSGSRKTSGSALFWTGALRVRGALAAPMNFLDAFSCFSSSSGSEGPERLGGVQSRVPRGGRDAERGVTGGGSPRAPPARGGRGPKLGSMWGCLGRWLRQKWGTCVGAAVMGRLDWMGGRGQSKQDLRKAKYQRAVEGQRGSRGKASPFLFHC